MIPSLFEEPDDDIFAGIKPGDGVYPEPSEDDRRNFRRIASGGSLMDEIGTLRLTR